MLRYTAEHFVLTKFLLTGAAWYKALCHLEGSRCHCSSRCFPRPPWPWSSRCLWANWRVFTPCNGALDAAPQGGWRQPNPWGEATQCYRKVWKLECFQHVWWEKEEEGEKNWLVRLTMNIPLVKFIDHIKSDQWNVARESLLSKIKNSSAFIDFQLLRGVFSKAANEKTW